MPRVRLLAPDPEGRVSGAAGDVIQVDGQLATDLCAEGVAVVDRAEPYRTAIDKPAETTEQR